QVADVAMHVATVGIQVEDWVPDELARAVIGHVPSATGVVHLDARHRQRLRGGDDVIARPACLDAEGDDGRMFEEQERVRYPPGPSSLDEILLQIEGFAVTNDAKTADIDHVAPVVPVVPDVPLVPVLDLRLIEILETVLERLQEPSGVRAVDEPVIVAE